MTNFLKGFHGFQMRISAISEAMAGDDALRHCIAHEFDEQLRKSISKVRNLPLYDKSIHWRTSYTQATTEEFDHASAVMEELLKIPDVPVTACGRLRAMKLVERGESIYVDGGEYGLRIAFRYRNEHSKREDAWSIAMLDHAETLRGNLANKPTRIDAYSEKASVKSLRDMVERHLGVKLTPVESNSE